MSADDARTPEESIATIVEELEAASRALALAEAEAAQLAYEVDRIGGPTFARFGYPITVESRGIADDLSGESGSEVSVTQILKDARDLQELIRLGND